MDPMKTAPVAEAGSKRGVAPSDDTSTARERKRSRGSPPASLARHPSVETSVRAAKKQATRRKPSVSSRSSRTQQETGTNAVLPSPPSSSTFRGVASSTKSLSKDSLMSDQGNNANNNLQSPQQKGTHQAMMMDPPSIDFILSQTVHTSPIPEIPSCCSVLGKWLFSILLVASGCCVAAFFQNPPIRSFDHVVPPKHALEAARLMGRKQKDDVQGHLQTHLSNVTLRDFLTDPEGFHLGMAPSFFGFYGYFGTLAAWDEGLANNEMSPYLETGKILSVAGASAGAMAAVLLAMGIPPRKAAEFCGTIDLPAFADPPGVLSAFKGDKFEQLMYEFIQSHVPAGHSMQMQDSKIPVAVTGFDLQTLSTLVMTEGCAARSARASATFPFLFQPVHWLGEGSSSTDGDEAKAKGRSSNDNKDYVLIDGGLEDFCGLEGLAATMEPSSSSKQQPSQSSQRVVNMVVGNFGGIGGVPPGPSEMPEGVSTSELLSISIRNLPQCGPWAMDNGPLAVEAARTAMTASLDLPLYRGKEEGHYELHIDASSFIPAP